ncbi:hypothetical protein AQUCO_00100694v1 [Aquilegia coerulea]|uniref:HTH myb-type domain-containing protein n=1 Tax=Aquilegia coerulea TaxID=218851 RepID=A0A2G5FBK4_AQUCA|nr:hypothetical protein AQUCO_00100694v1 [Aquilegia coerulea]
MVSITSEVCQDSKPHSYSMLLKSFVDHPEQTQKLEEFLARLEEECLKIEAFKRELPLCMQLLTNAIETYRQQLQSYRGNQGTNKPVLEEFIPLKHSSSEGSEKTSSISEKSSWMVSAQLWSQSNDGNKQQTITSSPKETDQSFSPKLSLDDKKRNGGGGAFLPFTKERNTCASPNTLRVLSDLALASTDDKELNDNKKCLESDKVKGGNGGTISEQGKTGAGNQTEAQAASTNSQTHRKARRCWSPDLHRRFVNALQMLGGSQVATPKQIREFMKVDGLTNDEVKSHLQKYRLHTRRPSPSHQAAGNQAPQLVVLGSIWVPPEYATAAHGGGPTIYSAHPASLATTHYCAPQEFYPAPSSHQLHHTIHHPHPHHQPHVYKTSSKTHSSPESDTQGAGDRSESIEDGKSESSSWKGDSGENGGERRGLASLRDEGEKSDGNEITLSF